MKPHPSAVERSLDLLGRPPHQSVLVGDSVSDIQVSLATGMQGYAEELMRDFRSNGYAKTPARGRELQSAGADAITDSVTALADLIRQSAHIV